MDRKTHINMVLIILGLRDERYNEAQQNLIKLIEDYDTWFESSKQKLLREFEWAFCVGTVDIERIDGNVLTPAERRITNNQYRYAHRLPSNVIGISEGHNSGVSGFEGLDYADVGSLSQDYPMRFRKIGKVPYVTTSSHMTTLDVIENIEDYDQFSPEFSQLLAYNIALHIAPTVRSIREVRGLVSIKSIMENMAKYVASNDIVNRRVG